MRAALHHARLAPKKANLVAAMVRRLVVSEALDLLEHLPKKGARMLHAVITSALANAQHNAGQDRGNLYIKSLTIQKGPSFKRSIPMARGRTRPIDKWTSHITVELGITVPEGKTLKEIENKKPAKKEEKEEVIEHVSSAPRAASDGTKRTGDSQGKGFSGKETGPSGPTFQPHHRGGRGS